MIYTMMRMSGRASNAMVALVGAALVVVLVSGCLPSPGSQKPRPLPSVAVTVPDVRGKTPEQAAAVLKQANLVLGKTLYTADSRWADVAKPGLVVAQSETPGAQLPRKTAVNIAVYAPTSREYGLVPDVQGMKYAEAVATLKEAGFLAGEVSWRHVEDQRLHNIVYRQSPEPGTTAKRWSKVNLGLYGPVEEGVVRVPKLTGLRAAEVPAVLAKHGLKLGEVTYEQAPVASLVGTVQAQSPAIGAKVKSGATVDIVVYKE
jgi:beta-lactam-binding protein with PASTA domain